MVLVSSLLGDYRFNKNAETITISTPLGFNKVKQHVSSCHLNLHLIFA